MLVPWNACLYVQTRTWKRVETDWNYEDQWAYFTQLLDCKLRIQLLVLHDNGNQLHAFWNVCPQTSRVSENKYHHLSTDNKWLGPRLDIFRISDERLYLKKFNGEYCGLRSLNLPYDNGPSDERICVQYTNLHSLVLPLHANVYILEMYAVCYLDLCIQGLLLEF